MWIGWPPFDQRMCRFEVDQCFNACGASYDQFGKVQLEIDRAEQWINNVL